jgi:type I restriction enzyme R subunit
MNERAKRAVELGLTKDEIAFYDAMTQNGSAALERGGATLRELTHEPVEVLSGNSKLDLTRKARVRDVMRTKVRQLLWKYKYQPDRQKN